MDGRWLLLSLVVAVVAALRMRSRASRHESDDHPTSLRAPTSAEHPVRAPQDSTTPAKPDVSRPRLTGDRASHGDGERDGDPLGPLDAGLGDALDRVWAEHARGAETLMEARLSQLVLRRVPVRAIRRAPGIEAVRVVFADGTVVLCRGTGQGDFGRLGVAMHRGSVHLDSYAHVADSTRLEFTWWQGQRLAATAVGLDQPD